MSAAAGKRPFDANLYRFGTTQPSYWEATADRHGVEAPPLESAEQCDVAVIGGGYTGLSAALHLARDFDLDVRVLDAGAIGWGASGRNGGFCCPGGSGVHSEELAKLVGIDAAREYYAAQVEAVELVRGLIESEGIDCEPRGEAVLEVAHTRRAFDRLTREHALLNDGLGMRAELLSAAACRERFYSSTENFGALLSGPAFGLHPLRYCLGLARAAQAAGARLHAESEVIEWSRTSSGAHRLTTRGGSLLAKRVVFATNGFMPENLHEAFFGRTIPVISAIIVTRVLTEEERLAQNWQTTQPAINSRRILNYYRLLPDGRFLFGGRGDVRGGPADEQRTYEWLRQNLGRIWPAWRNVEIEYRWHGLICMTASLLPAIGRVEDEPDVFFAFGYHGNGVNNATWAGWQIARWLGSGAEPPRLPAIVRGLSRRYPVPSLRKSYLRLGLFVSRQLDRFR